MSGDNEFLKTRAQIAAKIQELEPELQFLRDELKAFDRVESAMRRMGGNNNGKPNSLAESRTTVSIAETDSPGFSPQRGDLKRRILQIVTDKAGKRVSSTQIEKAMLQSGYLPTGKHFDISVYQTLLRLADQKRIEKKKTNGKVRFFSKQAT